MKISFVTTVFNEEKTIGSLIESLFKQTKMPDEIVIVDGGSTDATASVISNLILRLRSGQISNKKNIFKVLIKHGATIAQGRNYGIERASGDIIAMSDAGCVLHKDWLEKITEPFLKDNVDIVAGFYRMTGASPLQKALSVYLGIYPKRFDQSKFLPSARSMAFKKSLWRKIGGFNERLDRAGEDTLFNYQAVSLGAKFVRVKDAVVDWEVPKSILEGFKKFYIYAKGDLQAGIWWHPTQRISTHNIKIFSVFSRYAIGIAIFVLALRYEIVSYILVAFFLAYLAFPIWKMRDVVTDFIARLWLPIIQVTSDISVLSGTTFGFLLSLWNFQKKTLQRTFKKNFFSFFLIFIYIITTLSVIFWGLPNIDHPFPYHMDEWHQYQAVKNVFKHGSPNLEGSSNGTIFHFFLSGVLLTPFVLFKIVDPFIIKSPLDFLQEQEKLFVIFRLGTLLFGVLSIIFITKIAKLLKINIPVTVSLFVFTPVWLSLSNYFKYDIGVMFWIILSIFLILKFAKKPSFYNYVSAGIVSALAVAAKVSALPILPIYILSFFLFFKNYKKNYMNLAAGVFIFVITVVLFGIPDIVFGGRNIIEHIYLNVLTTPQSSDNYMLGYTFWSFMILYQFPTIFGHAFSIIFLFSLLIVFANIVKIYIQKRNLLKIKFFLVFSLAVFSISLIPLRIFVGANRAIVLLPFMVLLIGIALSQFNFKTLFGSKKFFLGVFAALLISQLIESYAWVYLKHTISPQKASSLWIEKNVPKDYIIGIENIPLYQFEPDIVLKEFYNKQNRPNYNSKYNYQIVDSKVKNLPQVVIVSNVSLSLNHEIKSSKKDLIDKLYMIGYKKTAVFKPALSFYKLFGNDLNYMFSGLIGYPTDISIFIKK